MRVVIVDDAGFIRELLKNGFEAELVEVVGEAANAFQAMKVVAETRPDLVVVDLVLPDKNGVVLAQELVSHFPDLRIVGLTSLDNPEIISSAKRAGCIDVVRKPFTREHIRTLVSHFYNKKVVANG